MPSFKTTAIFLASLLPLVTAAPASLKQRWTISTSPHLGHPHGSAPTYPNETSPIYPNGTSPICPNGTAPIYPNGTTPDPVIPGKYIIVLEPTANADVHLAWVNEVHARRLARRQENGDTPPAGIEKTYEINNFKGYAGSFDAETVEQIRASADVKHVEPDRLWHLNNLVHQPSPPNWGLKTISQRPPVRFDDYIFDSTAGENTWAYLVDSGIKADHPDFGGRVALAYNAVPGTPHEDVAGHGTHCAGIVGSNTFGVAKLTNLVSVKVFHEGGSDGSIVLDGFNWAVNDIIRNGRQNFAAISMSNGGPFSQAMNDAVKAAFDAGVITVAAAGNDNANAAAFSPASAAEAITVGAIDINNKRASFSNWGSSVDLFAPGVDIRSTTNDGQSGELSGTSMACPFVTGLVVYFRALHGPSPPGQLVSNLLRVASQGAVQDAGPGSPNLLAYNDDNVSLKRSLWS